MSTANTAAPSLFPADPASASPPNHVFEPLVGLDGRPITYVYSDELLALYDDIVAEADPETSSTLKQLLAGAKDARRLADLCRSIEACRKVLAQTVTEMGERGRVLEVAFKLAIGYPPDDLIGDGSGVSLDDVTRLCERLGVNVTLARQIEPNATYLIPAVVRNDQAGVSNAE